MAEPLIAPSWRPAATVAAGLGLALVVGLGLALHGAHGAAFDEWVIRKLFYNIGARGARWLLVFSEPVLTGGVCVAVAVGAALQRSWRLTALAVLGPVVAEVLAELVGKPVFDRTFNANDALAGHATFPSGHETGVVSAALIALLVLTRTPLRRAAKVWVAVLLGIWVVLGALGLTRNFYHYFTDTIGAVGVSVFVVLGLALLLDRSTKRARSRLPAPVAENPVTDSPVADRPVVDSPVVDSPVVDSPVVDRPVVGPTTVDRPGRRPRPTPAGGDHRREQPAMVAAARAAGTARTRPAPHRPL